MSEREADGVVRAMRRPEGRIAVVTRNLKLEAEGQLSLDPHASAPSALDYLLSALAVDLLAGFSREAARAGVELDDAELELSARLENPLVALGVEGESGSPALGEVTGSLYASVDAPADALAALWRKALARAPVYSTLARGTLLHIELKSVP